MFFAIDTPNFGDYSEPRLLAELAKEAEDAGWDGFFLWDHIGADWPLPVADPWIALAAMAMTTRRIKLGPLVTPLPRRRPWKLARETATLDHLSHGRLILGVGIGSDRAHEYSCFAETTRCGRTRARFVALPASMASSPWQKTARSRHKRSGVSWPRSRNTAAAPLLSMSPSALPTSKKSRSGNCCQPTPRRVSPGGWSASAGAMPSLRCASESARGRPCSSHGSSAFPERRCCDEFSPAIGFLPMEDEL